MKKYEIITYLDTDDEQYVKDLASDLANETGTEVSVYEVDNRPVLGDDRKRRVVARFTR